jgi:nucleoid DNA-binding protein
MANTTQKQNVVDDVATLLKLTNKTMEELVNKTNLCIGSIIHEAILEGRKTAIINIGIGALSIDLVDMQCKFLPSSKLKATIKKSLTAGTDLLELQLSESISDKLVSACLEALD